MTMKSQKDVAKVPNSRAAHRRNFVVRFFKEFFVTHNLVDSLKIMFSSCEPCTAEGPSDLLGPKVQDRLPPMDLNILC